MITKKFNGLLRKLEQDQKNLDIKINNTERKGRSKQKKRLASADTSPVAKRDTTSKPRRRKSTKSCKQRSGSRGSTNSKSRKMTKSVKSMLKHASTQIMDHTQTVEPRHSYGAFSPPQGNKANETANSPTVNVVSDLKPKESAHQVIDQDAESSAIYTKKSSIQPLSDIQY